MILMRENPFWGPFEEGGPEMATSKVSAKWAQKSRDFQGYPFHPVAKVMDLPPSKSWSPYAI